MPAPGPEGPTADLAASVVIGAGPAGLGPLVCALQQGLHGALLDRGVVWVDPQPTVGHGTLGAHAITSDTAATVLLECLTDAANPLTALADGDAAGRVRRYGSGPLPLSAAAGFLQEVGRVARDVVDAHPPSEMVLGRRATRVVVRGPAHFTVELDDGQLRHGRTVVFALGGRQDRAETLARELKPGLTLEGPLAAKSVLTGALFRRGGLDRAVARLRGVDDPRVVVVGGSHSAVTAVNLLLDSGVAFGPGAVTLVYRRKPKVFYPDREAARADGYRDFDDRDVCPTTGRVFRLAGLRMAARDLMRRVWGLGEAEPEARVEAVALDALSRDRLATLLDRADLVVPAFGYRPNTLPVVGGDGRPVALRADAGPREPLVDNQCRVLGADGAPVPGLFGIGLASGFVPRGPSLGGEASFDGQTNGLWLYQNGVGRIVLEHILAAGEPVPAGR